MLKLVIIGAVLSYNLIKVASNEDMGPGRWILKYINKCEEGGHTFKFDIIKTRINRTHDGIDACLTLEEDLTEAFGIRIDVCKEVDGGCKPYQVIVENSLAKFLEKYTKENLRAILELAGVNPPQFPLPAGQYDIKDFFFNTDELPSDGPYGEFAGKCFILRGTVEVGCVEIYAEFIKDDDE